MSYRSQTDFISLPELLAFQKLYIHFYKNVTFNQKKDVLVTYSYYHLQTKNMHIF